MLLVCVIKWRRVKFFSNFTNKTFDYVLILNYAHNRRF